MCDQRCWLLVANKAAKLLYGQGKQKSSGTIVCRAMGANPGKDDELFSIVLLWFVDILGRMYLGNCLTSGV